MVTIPRYLDNPPQLLWFELDELLFLLISIIVGILTRTLTICLLVGLASVWVISKLKGGQSDGIVLHWWWWYGIPGFRLRRGPPSQIRDYCE
jgi:conjugal transfer pilus assembly protein TraL